jgi:hypothetical protein
MASKNRAPKLRGHKTSPDGRAHKHRKTQQSDHPPVKKFCELSINPLGRRILFSRG